MKRKIISMQYIAKIKHYAGLMWLHTVASVAYFLRCSKQNSISLVALVVTNIRQLIA